VGCKCILVPGYLGITQGCGEGDAEDDKEDSSRIHIR